MNVEELMDAIGKVDLAYVKEAEQWKRSRFSRKAARWALPAAAALALMVGGGYYGVQNMKQKNFEGTAESACGSAMESAAEDTGILIKESAEESVLSEESVVINESEMFQTSIASMAESDHTDRLSADELQNYFGITIQPEVLPENLKLEESEGYLIYYNAEGTVINDNNSLLYKDASGERSLTIGVRTVDMGEVTKFVSGERPSYLNGVEVTIGHYKDSTEADCYLALFEKNGVYFTVKTEMLTEEEVLDVLRELTGE